MYLIIRPRIALQHQVRQTERRTAKGRGNVREFSEQVSGAAVTAANGFSFGLQGIMPFDYHLGRQPAVEPITNLQAIQLCDASPVGPEG
jgi:hypothetical protein